MRFSSFIIIVAYSKELTICHTTSKSNLWCWLVQSSTDSSTFYMYLKECMTEQEICIHHHTYLKRGELSKFIRNFCKWKTEASIGTKYEVPLPKYRWPLPDTSDGFDWHQTWTNDNDSITYSLLCLGDRTEVRKWSGTDFWSNRVFIAIAVAWNTTNTGRGFHIYQTVSLLTRIPQELLHR